jgi:beta-RFAP synthase
MTVWVRAPARLHLGVLDPSGTSGRWFAGLGVALEEPNVVVSAEPAASLEVCGDQGERAYVVARRFMEHYGPVGARLTVHAALPRHVGLGSGTQLALSVAEALARVRGLELSIEQMSRLTGRAARSGVGTWVYRYGGLVVEGGHRTKGDSALPPLLLHRPLPEHWWFVVACPPGREGPSGAEEDEALVRIPPVPVKVVERMCRIVLLGLLPALEEADGHAFGAALTELQALVGDVFAPVQGGRYLDPRAVALLETMRRSGALGGGQSSWGPAVFGLVEGEAAAREVARTLRARYEDVTVWVSRPCRTGRRIWIGRNPGIMGASGPANAHA